MKTSYKIPFKVPIRSECHCFLCKNLYMLLLVDQFINQEYIPCQTYYEMLKAATNMLYT